MKRRSFFRILTLPALGWLPKQRTQNAPSYTDSEGRLDLTALFDRNRATGVQYGA